MKNFHRFEKYYLAVMEGSGSFRIISSKSKIEFTTGIWVEISKPSLIYIRHARLK
jgi:hypothetical protein